MAKTANPTRILRLAQVIARIGVSRSTIYLWISEGEFPRQVNLGAHAVGWLESEIEDWIATRITFRQIAA